MKIGLYSVTYLGLWYQGRALTMPEVLERAVKFGYDGIEIDGKRPHGNPVDWTPDDRQRFRDLCASRGIDIIGVASNNDFSSPIPEHQECQVLMVREQIGLCRDLGGSVVRLFMAWPGVSVDAAGLASYSYARTVWAENNRYRSHDDQWRTVRAGLEEVTRYAEDAGVVVALQNHGPVLRNYQDMLAMIQEIGSPALRACLDAPILERQDDEYVWRATWETGTLQVLSHFGDEYEEQRAGSVRQAVLGPEDTLTNYPAFIRGMKAVGYDGYISYEFCHPASNRRHEIQGLDYVDNQARLALRYLRNLLEVEDAYTGQIQIVAS